MSVPSGMSLESLLDFRHSYLLPVSIPVQETVTGDRHMREHKRSARYLRLDCARGPDPDDVRAAMLRLHFPGLEINVGKGIKLIHHDIDVVSTDSGRKSGHPDTFIFSCHRYEFA